MAEPTTDRPGAKGRPAERPPGDPSPNAPTDLSKPTWLGVLKRSLREFKEDNVTDWAAALTYYGVLSLFPAMIVLLALLSIFGQEKSTIDTLTGIVKRLGPPSAVDTFAKPIQGVVQQKAAAGTLLGVGLLASLWSASAYIGAFMRASNAIYEVQEGRPFWKLRPLQIIITLLGVILIALILLGLVVSGPLARAVGDAMGLGSTAVTVWGIVKWPVMIVIVSLMISTLYWLAPNVKQPKFRWFSAGGFLALVVWVVASALFALYVANFGSYNKTYGSLGAVIIFLVWVWIANIAILLGAEFNAEVERGRELQTGDLKAEEEIQLPPRQASKKA